MEFYGAEVMKAEIGLVVGCRIRNLQVGCMQAASSHLQEI